MHVSKYVFRLPFIPRRSERSVWKGKEADHGCCTAFPPEDGDVDFFDDSYMAVSLSELDLHSDSSPSSSSSSSRAGLVRIVSWASILGHRSRWTTEQERDLALAEHELARCQKAWSSEQEVWLTHIKALTEEKEAHEDFLHQRAKQQDDEQQHFRRVWTRRKSYEEQQQQLLVLGNPRRTNSGLGRLRGRGSYSRDEMW